MKPNFIIFAVFLTLILSACGGGSSDGFDGRSGYNQGKLTLSITDAAIDDIAEVWVRFESIELKPAEGSSMTIELDPHIDINLLNLQGSLSQDFFSGMTVDAGDFNWVRLHVSVAEDGVLDSYVVMKDGAMHELDIPSGAQTGLKINTPFTVGEHADVHMTIDFDLRRSIVMNGGKYKLKPVLRLVDNTEAGAINGSIGSDLTVGANCSDDQPDTGNAIYVFAGADAAFDDIDNQDPEPVTTALMTLNTETGEYDYEVGFLPAGVYTVAYTCMADQDDPTTDDAITFLSLGNMTVDMPVDTGGAEFNR